MPRAFDLHLELSRVSPPVWRVLRVPADLALDDLHHAIQAVMGWNDFHPHVFEIRDRDYGPRQPIDDDEDDGWTDHADAWAGEDSDVTVAQAFAQSPEGFIYVYDFAEDWRVVITCRAEFHVEAPVVVSCVAGEHAGPQQDSRDPAPFSTDAANRRLAATRQPRATPEYPAGPRASADAQLLAHLTLAMLLLGSRPTRHGRRDAWKHVRAEVLDGLQEAGLIDTAPARKSVTLTDAGVAHAERWLRRLREAVPARTE